jgi:hypothetical protein
MTAIKAPVNATEQQEIELVNYEIAKFLNRVKKLNSELKIVQVTDVNVRINKPQGSTYKRWWEKLFKKS